MKIKVHPAADVWPMLNSADLAELAADIKANGLIHPIVLKDGVLIDGRNRLEACVLSGVEPRFEEATGVDDVEAYVVSVATQRRNLTKGQMAMGVAMIWPGGGKGGRGKSINPELSSGLSDRYLRQARAVLRDSRDIAA